MSINCLQQQVVLHGLDGIIASSYENIRYLTGASISSLITIPTRLAALVVSAKDPKPTFVICRMEQPLAKKQSKIEDFRGYEEFQQSPLAMMADIVHEKGLDRGCIGIEMREICAGDFKSLKRYLPDVTFVAADELFDKIRMIKSAEEISFMADIAIATDKAIYDGLSTAHPGVTELDVLGAITKNLILQGTDIPAFLVLGAGQNAKFIHAVAGQYRLTTGDILRCDVGGRWRGYYSDIARTVVVGKANQKQIEIYKILWDVHEETIDHAKPGVKVSDLFIDCVNNFAKHGINDPLPHIGHSLGIGLHENPILCPTDHTVLEPGMVLCFEPIIMAEEAIYHVEDLVVITQNGSQILSRSRDWSKLLAIG